MSFFRGVKRLSERDISPPPLKRQPKQAQTSLSSAAASTSSTTNKPKMNSDFFAPLSQKSKKSKDANVLWRIIKSTCISGHYKPLNYAPAGNQDGTSLKRRIAAFDLDGTLITTKSGNVFPRNGSDWQWWCAAVPKKIRTLSSQGYSIAILTNQKAISLNQKGKTGDTKSYVNFKERASAVAIALDVPISIYAATEADEFRKPRPGLWHELMYSLSVDTKKDIDFPNSLFVGDAAGRPKDHSCADRDFAANIDLSFVTPEQFFLGEEVDLEERRFDPKKYISRATTEAKPPQFVKKNPVELVIFVGSPSSGKSTFYWKYLEPMGYRRVNQDVLKTRPKCLQVAGRYLHAGESVAVDNTNANRETRAHWVDLASANNVPIRCIHLLTPREVCAHNNAVRAASSNVPSLNPESRSLLPKIAFGDFQKRFAEPTMNEGFQDITRIEFQFMGDEEAARVWGEYWL